MYLWLRFGLQLQVNHFEVEVLVLLDVLAGQDLEAAADHDAKPVDLGQEQEQHGDWANERHMNRHRFPNRGLWKSQFHKFFFTFWKKNIQNCLTVFSRIGVINEWEERNSTQEEDDSHDSSVQNVDAWLF